MQFSGHHSIFRNASDMLYHVAVYIGPIQSPYRAQTAPIQTDFV